MVLLKVKHSLESSRRLLKTVSVSDSFDLGAWGKSLRFNKFPGDADAAVPWTTL